MKTNRNFVPKSAGVTGSAGSYQSNVVAQAGYDNVGDVGLSVPSKTQCVRRSSSVPCHGPRSHIVSSVPPNTRCAGQLNSVPCHSQGLEVFGVPDVGISVSPKRRCIRKSSSAACRAQRLSTFGIPFGVDCQLLSQSTHDDNVNIHLGAPGERYHRTDDVVDTDGFPNRSPGTQQQNAWSHTRQESTIGEDYLRRQSRTPSPPPVYKHIGSCIHNCQHCGALFWYEEHLKSIARGLRPRYNNK
nr:hypothetical protein [Tanacetum cinerariifolium]